MVPIMVLSNLQLFFYLSYVIQLVTSFLIHIYTGYSTNNYFLHFEIYHFLQQLAEKRRVTLGQPTSDGSYISNFCKKRIAILNISKTYILHLSSQYNLLNNINILIENSQLSPPSVITKYRHYH